MTTTMTTTRNGLQPSPLPSTPTSATWAVTEAPASCCLKWRVGALEVMYTLRGPTDAELQRRIQATLPWLQCLLLETEERTAIQTETLAPPVTPAPGHHATPAALAPQPEGWCAIHAVQMEQRSNTKGSWHSHRLSDGTYCKGKERGVP